MVVDPQSPREEDRQEGAVEADSERQSCHCGWRTICGQNTCSNQQPDKEGQNVQRRTLVWFISGHIFHLEVSIVKSCGQHPERAATLRRVATMSVYLRNTQFGAYPSQQVEAQPPGERRVFTVQTDWKLGFQTLHQHRDTERHIWSYI